MTPRSIGLNADLQTDKKSEYETNTQLINKNGKKELNDKISPRTVSPGNGELATKLD